MTTGNGNDVFTVAGTQPGTTELSTTGGADQIAVRAISGNTTIHAGSGNDTISVGSTAGLWYTTTPAGVPGSNRAFLAVNGTVDAISALLTVDGDTGVDTLNIDDSGDLNDNTGTLTASRIDGLDMGGHIEYAHFTSALNIILGHGNDVFTVESTHPWLTTIEGRSGNDQINIKTIAGRRAWPATASPRRSCTARTASAPASPRRTRPAAPAAATM